MSRKRSLAGFVADKKIESSDNLLELEDNREKEKFNMKKESLRLLALREKYKQHFDSTNEGFSMGISTVCYQECADCLQLYI